ncbi:Holin of 3TMs, for gene-transfer release [Pseudooceanicola antarcticus]|uniref:Carboxylesterase n=1 Tax=Pseudooceanicola antarcticus TaxID=1247613 RepID=A0A285J747_9RHOB|nr:holin family protein [Pseudooceanicola antarcticus]PJE26894.1 carboxylesterase [Pseudooceanicola antarcticus]SNY55687.1 Holin of 3TMs, for gene-transfer release [Pseudooceanicola antarcticus]
MGLMSGLLEVVFGGGRNVIRDTAEVFRTNAEATDQRDLAAFQAALAQHGREFRDQRRGFDRFMDGLNRLPRPAMALGAIGLFVSAMWDPVWFSERMQGLALVPEALWWLLGAVVSFYFGARHQVKGQEFQREIARSMTLVPQVVENIEALRQLDAPDLAEPVRAAEAPGGANPALEAWRKAG